MFHWTKDISHCGANLDTTSKASGGVVVYNKDGKLLTSRRWELFREGIEGYKLAHVAFGNDGVLDAKKNPALMTLAST